MEPPSHSAAGSDTPTPAAKKERNVVTWTPQEDDRLRDEVAIHGVDNWTIVAGRLRDKTGRQCRRRWYTYLNAECKKGGWSAEEDMLLCEAQKIFGNKWTEIAKVVSGRTDNAVKNRFSTLCKKRAKVEDSAKENISPFSRNKRVLTCNGQIVNGISEASMPTIHARYVMSDFSHQRMSTSDTLLKPLVKQEEQLMRPLAALRQNTNTSGCLPTGVPLSNSKEVTIHNELTSRIRGAFFNQDDPRVTALLRQADLLSSLAAKVNTENTSQSLEDAWKELQVYLGQADVTGLRKKMSGMEFRLDDFEDLVGDMKCANIEDQLPLRDPYLREESQATSEYSVASSDGLYSQESRNIEQQAEDCFLRHSAEATDICENVLCRSINSVHMKRAENIQQQAEEDSLSNKTEISILCDTVSCPINNDQATFFPFSDGLDGNGKYCLTPEFSSPLQTMPIFTEGLPSPQFSASERQILLKMFGLSSPVPSPNPVKMPSCKKALLDSLCPS